MMVTDKDRGRSNAVSAQRRGENFNISRWAPVQRMGNPTRWLWRKLRVDN
jgi:hypothetical protein